MRERYRQQVRLLRRVQEKTGGGKPEVYRPIATVSCEVRDEKYDTQNADQGAPIVEQKIVSMRARLILADDAVEWQGNLYEIVYVDGYNNRGREIRLRVRRRKAHWSVLGENA